MMAAAAASLPPQAFATGSGVINMLRQTGIALGVAILVPVLGTGAELRPSLANFQRAWWMTAGIALLALVPALGLMRMRTPAADLAQRPSPPAAGDRLPGASAAPLASDRRAGSAR